MSDHFHCDNCNTQEHIELLDAKASRLGDENSDYEHFECIACYGPGWGTNLTEAQTAAMSIAPQLKPFYAEHFVAARSGAIWR